MKQYLGILVLGLATSASAQYFSDDFNRPDAADLGPNWSVIGTGSATRTIGNQAGNVVAANNLSLVTLGNYSAAYTHGSVSADVFHNGTSALSYVALAMGHNGTTTAGNGLFVKVQGSGATGFTSIGFYTGQNGSSTGHWSNPPVFFTASSPFLAAHMVVWASSATTINLGLDTNFDNTFDQTYSRDLNLGTMTFGTQVGLAVYGTSGKADNFAAGVVPEPATMAVLGLGAAALLRRRKK